MAAPAELVVLVPVLDRPHRAAPVAESVFTGTASVTARVVFLLSPGDWAEADAVDAVQARWGPLVTIVEVGWQPGPGDWARKINHGVELTDEPWVLLGADDLHFHPGWDREALSVAAMSGAGVIAVNDLGNPRVQQGRHATHPLMARWYIDEHGTIDEPGKAVHEGYGHMYVDNELTETAQARELFAPAPRSHVEHLHPIWRKAETDSTYELGQDREQARLDRALLARRRKLWAADRRQVRVGRR